VLFRYTVVLAKVGSPPTCGERGPAIRNKVKVAFMLHSFQGCFSWQTKPRIYDWNNSISDQVYPNIHTGLLYLTTSPLAISSAEIISQQIAYI